jgi:protein tyrosine/serine phosphatase
MKRATMLLALLTLPMMSGCGTTFYASGVPNLVEVRPGLWRSGQPTSQEQWEYLKSLGIRRVVKLNFSSEGSDDGAILAGLEVHVFSIQPAGDADIFDAIANTFIRPDPDLLERANQVIAENSGVLVHCTHGWDRTGLVIGRSRVLLEHWSKDRAYEEMLKRGFHPLLRGLSETWEDFRP